MEPTPIPSENTEVTREVFSSPLLLASRESSTSAAAIGVKKCKSSRNVHDPSTRQSILRLLVSQDEASLTCHIPWILKKVLKEDVVLQHHRLETEGVVAFIDVCGFTQITEALRKSSDGSCGIAEHLNEFFSLLISIIQEHNGDVLQFSGDALLVVWWKCSETAWGVPARNCISAVTKILKITRATYLYLEESSAELRLGVHCGVGIGSNVLVLVGGDEGSDGIESWRSILLGDAVRDAVNLVDTAKINEASVSTEFYDVLSQDNTVNLSELLNHSCLVDKAGYVFSLPELKSEENRICFGGNDTKQTGSSNPVLKNEKRAIKLQKKSNLSVAAKLSDALLREKVATEAVRSAKTSFKQNVYSFLFSPILTSLQQSQTGELRVVSTIFTHVSVLNEKRQDIEFPTELLQEATLIIQAELAARGGILNKMLFDDKGVTFLSLFGLPGHAHSDDSTRAVAFSKNTAIHLEDIGVTAAYGVTRSKVFSGWCGSKERREYSVLGDGVNTAARTMQHSVGLAQQKETGSVICVDDTTCSATQSQFPYISPPHSLQFKGKKIVSKVWELNYRNDSRSSSLKNVTASGGMFKTDNRGKTIMRRRKGPGVENMDLGVAEDESGESNSSLSSTPGARRLSVIINGSGESENTEQVDDDVLQIFGRDSQMDAVADFLQHLVKMQGVDDVTLSHPAMRTIVVTGDASMGKTYLLAKTVEVAQELDLVTLTAECSSIDGNIPFFVLSKLFTFFGSQSVQWLCEEVDIMDVALRPILNPIFPDLAFEETDTTLTMGEQEKIDLTCELAKGIVARQGSTATVFIIDDLQWADAESVAALTYIARNMQTVGIVSSTNKDDDTSSVDRRESVVYPNVTIPCTTNLESHYDSIAEWNTQAHTFSIKIEVHLASLSFSDIRHMIASALSCKVDPLVVETIYKQAGGNPGFSEQLVVSLCDTNVLLNDDEESETGGSSPLIISDGVLRFSPGVNVEELRLPEGMEEIVTDRFDKLSSQQKMFLKTASVLGGCFSLLLLCRTITKIQEAQMPHDVRKDIHRGSMDVILQLYISLKAACHTMDKLEALGFIQRVSATGTSYLNEYLTEAIENRVREAKRAENAAPTALPHCSIPEIKLNNNLQDNTTAPAFERVPGSRFRDSVSSDASVVNTGLKDVVYVFRLHVMRDVLYRMLVAKDKRETHSLIADVLEEDLHATNSRPYSGSCGRPTISLEYPPLDPSLTTTWNVLHHLQSACQLDRAIPYLGLAAETLLLKGHNQSALIKLTETLDLASSLPPDNPIRPSPALINHFIALQALSLYLANNRTAGLTTALSVLVRVEENKLWTSRFEASWRQRHDRYRARFGSVNDFCVEEEPEGAVSCCCCGAEKVVVGGLLTDAMQGCEMRPPGLSERISHRFASAKLASETRKIISRWGARDKKSAPPPPPPIENYGTASPRRAQRVAREAKCSVAVPAATRIETLRRASRTSDISDSSHTLRSSRATSLVSAPSGTFRRRSVSYITTASDAPERTERNRRVGSFIIKEGKEKRRETGSGFSEERNVRAEKATPTPAPPFYDYAEEDTEIFLGDTFILLYVTTLLCVQEGSAEWGDFLINKCLTAYDAFETSLETFRCANVGRPFSRQDSNFERIIAGKVANVVLLRAFMKFHPIFKCPSARDAKELPFAASIATFQKHLNETQASRLVSSKKSSEFGKHGSPLLPIQDFTAFGGSDCCEQDFERHFKIFSDRVIVGEVNRVIEGAKGCFVGGDMSIFENFAMLCHSSSGVGTKACANLATEAHFDSIDMKIFTQQLEAKHLDEINFEAVPNLSMKGLRLISPDIDRPLSHFCLLSSLLLKGLSCLTHIVTPIFHSIVTEANTSTCSFFPNVYRKRIEDGMRSPSIEEKCAGFVNDLYAGYSRGKGGGGRAQWGASLPPPGFASYREDGGFSGALFYSANVSTCFRTEAYTLLSHCYLQLMVTTGSRQLYRDKGTAVYFLLAIAAVRLDAERRLNAKSFCTSNSFILGQNGRNEGLPCADFSGKQRIYGVEVPRRKSGLKSADSLLPSREVYEEMEEEAPFVPHDDLLLAFFAEAVSAVFLLASYAYNSSPVVHLPTVLLGKVLKTLLIITSDTFSSVIPNMMLVCALHAAIETALSVEVLSLLAGKQHCPEFPEALHRRLVVKAMGVLAKLAVSCRPALPISLFVSGLYHLRVELNKAKAEMCFEQSRYMSGKMGLAVFAGRSHIYLAKHFYSPGREQKEMGIARDLLKTAGCSEDIQEEFGIK